MGEENNISWMVSILNRKPWRKQWETTQLYFPKSHDNSQIENESVGKSKEITKLSFAKNHGNFQVINKMNL